MAFFIFFFYFCKQNIDKGVDNDIGNAGFAYF